MNAQAAALLGVAYLLGSISFAVLIVLDIMWLLSVIRVMYLEFIHHSTTNQP